MPISGFRSVTCAEVVGTTLVHLFECLGLVDLQDSHGMHGRGGLARSTVSFGRERSRQLTGFGQETRAIPPSDGPAIKGSEDGGGR